MMKCAPEAFLGRCARTPYGALTDRRKQHQPRAGTLSCAHAGTMQGVVTPWLRTLNVTSCHLTLVTI